MCSRSILHAGLTLWAGDPETAVESLHGAGADCRWLHQPPNLIGHLHTYAALSHAVRGDREAALAAADARLAGLVADERTSGRRTVWLNHFLFFKARVAAALDDGPTLREMARQLAAHADPTEPGVLSRERGTLPARLAELDGRWDDAVAGYRAALADAAALGMYGQAEEVRMRLAHALLQLGRSHEAAQALAPVFERVRASGEPGGVLLAGRLALAALASAPWGEWLADGERRASETLGADGARAGGGNTRGRRPGHRRGRGGATPPSRRRTRSAAASARCCSAWPRATATS